MRELFLFKKKESGPAYKRIANAVRSAVREGRLRPSEALPSTRDMAGTFRVHRHTVMTALDELIAEGWIEAAPRKGYFVHATLPDKFFKAKMSGESTIRRGLAGLPTPARSVETHLTPGKAKYRFLSGMPDLREFPIAEFRSHLVEALNLRGEKLLGYGDPAGYPDFVEEIETYLRRMRGITGRRVVVTHGSQEAIFLLAQVYLKPGDSFAIESFGYRPALQALVASGAKAIPIPVDEFGVDVDKVEEVLQRTAIKMIYVTPHHQYPTTVTLPVARRMKLIELAIRHGFYILEDDYDHEFHYRGQPVAPLAAEDESGVVLYVSTFSKVLSPSLRLGFMALPESAYQPVVDFRRIVTRQSDQLVQYAVTLWMRSGGFERHLRRMRRHYQERRDVVVSALEKTSLSFQVPDGGMALWLNTGKPTVRLAGLLEKDGVLVLPEKNLRLDGRDGTHLRLGFANQRPSELRDGLELLLKRLE